VPARSRLSIGFIVVCCAACSAGGCGASSEQTAQSPTPTTVASVPSSSGRHIALDDIRVLTALGDSVPYGTKCDCDPYPQLTGDDVAEVTGHPVDVFNGAVPGATSGNVVEQLQHDPKVATDADDSNVVMVEVGANDVAYSADCGTTAACYDAKLPEISRNLDTIVSELRTTNSDVTVVLLDYWSVWLGGQYAMAQGPDYVAAAETVTANVDATIRAIAVSTGSIYVDLRTAFRGPDLAWDETHLLAPDGEHPNAQGHQRIAEAVAHTIVAG
jgi:lysophospholipase L1-like esterase